MIHVPIYRLFLVVLLYLAAGVSLRAQPLQRYEFAHQQMGTLWRLVFFAPDDATATRAARAALSRIDELNQVFSDFEETSELSRLTRFAGPDTVARVSSDLWVVLERAAELSEKSGGAFDITIGPLSRLWRRAFRQQSFPDTAQLAAARARVGYGYLELLPDRRSVRVARPELRLDAGGIAKGYAVDAAMEILRRHGLPHALVDGGGDLLVGEAPPGEAGWRIQVPYVDSGGQVSDSTLLLTNAAMATSGDTYRYLEWEGLRYSHLIDPRSGFGVTFRALVSVRCPTCTLADGLASAVSVQGPDGDWRQLEALFPDCRFQLIFPGEDQRFHQLGQVFNQNSQK